MEQLDLTSYKNALASLDEVIKVYNSDRENKITRDSLIQRFEYTYSLALKMMKRYFKISAFENDVGYIYQHQDISGKQDKLTQEELTTLGI